MSFENWVEDVELLAGWLKDRSPDLPLVLHGLQLGAILAGKAFSTGVGDALLLWDPPANANQALRATLLRRISMDQAFRYGEERKPLSDYLRRIEDGHLLDVDGYQWSGRLWRDSFAFALPAELVDETGTNSDRRRPVRIVKLDQSAVPLIKGSSVGYDVINKDFRALFADNLEWIATSLAIPREGNSEQSH